MREIKKKKVLDGGKNLALDLTHYKYHNIKNRH